MSNKNFVREYMNKNNLNEFYRKLYNKAQRLRSPFISSTDKYKFDEAIYE